MTFYHRWTPGKNRFGHPLEKSTIGPIAKYPTDAHVHKPFRCLIDLLIPYCMEHAQINTILYLR